MFEPARAALSTAALSTAALSTAALSTAAQLALPSGHDDGGRSALH